VSRKTQSLLLYLVKNRSAVRGGGGERQFYDGDDACAHMTLLYKVLVVVKYW